LTDVAEMGLDGFVFVAQEISSTTQENEAHHSSSDVRDFFCMSKESSSYKNGSDSKHNLSEKMTRYYSGCANL